MYVCMYVCTVSMSA